MVFALGGLGPLRDRDAYRQISRGDEAVRRNGSIVVAMGNVGCLVVYRDSDVAGVSSNGDLSGGRSVQRGGVYRGTVAYTTGPNYGLIGGRGGVVLIARFSYSLRR